MALVLIRLGGLGLAFYKEHVALFRLVLLHPSSELSTIFLLDSLFFEESFGKFSKIFSIGLTGWEPVEQVLLGNPFL